MFLFDANVLIYRTTDSRYREPCRALVNAAIDRQADGVVSTAVLEEVWHIELRGRLDGLDGLTVDYYDSFSPLLPVTDDVFRRALSIDVAALGALDRIHAATCLELGIRTIVTADAAFDGVRGLRRVDPLDVRAVQRLLT